MSAKGDAVAMPPGGHHPPDGAATVRLKGYRNYELTEVGMAEYFKDHVDRPILYIHKSRVWYFFNKHWWEEDEGGKVAKLLMRAYRQRCNDAIVAGDEPYAQKLMTKFGSDHGARGTLRLAQSLLGKKDADVNWGLHPELLGVANGVVDLTTGELRGGEPEDMISRHAPTAYRPGARADRFRLFLLEIFGGDAAMVEFVQRAVGYTLTGETAEQVWFLCQGGGGNGKSTLLEGALLPAIGRGILHVTRPETFLKQKYRSAISNDVRELKDARGALVLREPSSWSELDESFLTGLLTGTAETARNLNERNVDFVPYFKLWMVANHKPRIRSDTKGVWRRIRFLKFEQQFDPGDEPGLPRALLGEREGILAWAVEGAVKWYADNSLRVPERVLRDTEEYRREQDELAEFWETHILGGGRCERGKLYGRYRSWATAMKILYPLGSPRFNEKVEGKFPDAVKRDSHKGASEWIGISLAEKEEIDGTWSTD